MSCKEATVYIVDDDEDICNSFRWLFESANLTVQTYKNASDFLDDYDGTQYGCLIIDVRMPIMNGIELLEQLQFKKNQLSIIVITGFGDISMAVKTMKAGAIDFIPKPVNPQYLLETTQKCLKKTQDYIAQIELYEKINSLTKRERQIMRLVVEGKLNKQIAYDLHISISTVEAHRSKVMKKMQTKNLAALIKSNLLYSSFFVDNNEESEQD